MAILSEKRQKCFGLRRKDVRMRAIICDDDGRFAKKLEQLIMQYYRNMGMTIDTTVVTNPQNLLKRNDLANFDIAFLDADMKPIDGIEVGRALRKRKPKIIIVFVSAYLEFAPKGYTIDAFRYVLKQDIQNTLPLCLSDILQHFTPDRAFLTYKQRGEVFRIPCHDIMYMPALAMAAPARTMAAGGYFNGQRDLAGCFAAAVHSFFVECFNTIWIY